jgi:hypothetical protein
MAIKVKEMKDDALIDVKVNKTYYLMVKALSFYLFNQIKVDDKEAYLKSITTGEYANFDDLQKSFYTVTLLLAEIEQSVTKNNLFDEKEVLQPGDEGYVAPTLD